MSSHRSIGWIAAGAIALSGFPVTALAAWDGAFLLELEQKLADSTHGETEATASGERRADEKAEFDRICGQVQIAPTLSGAELRQLIEDCEVLMKRLESSTNPQAKIWIQRLRMCRDFFAYSLELQGEE